MASPLASILGLDVLSDVLAGNLLQNAQRTKLSLLRHRLLQLLHIVFCGVHLRLLLFS